MRAIPAGPSGALVEQQAVKQLIIASVASPAGKTALTAALGHLLAEAGRPVRLLRLRPEGGEDARSEDDARALAAVPGCTSPGRALLLRDVRAHAREAAAAGGVAIVEVPTLQEGLPKKLSAKVLLCSIGSPEKQMADLTKLAASLGEALLGVVATAVPRAGLERAASVLAEAGLACLAVLPEERLLAAPSIAEMASALGASFLVRDAGQDEAVEHLMIGPIAADPGMPHFGQHGRKAVITRFDKTDLLLAALATELDCLVLTGGQRPSPYVLDRVESLGQEVSVLLAPHETVTTVGLLDELYAHTRFAGQRKLERMVELLRERLDLEALAAKLG